MLAFSISQKSFDFQSFKEMSYNNFTFFLYLKISWQQCFFLDIQLKIKKKIENSTVYFRSAIDFSTTSIIAFCRS